MAWIYAVMGNKGGPGKSAEAVGLASALARRGRKVGFVDLDAQGNATRRLGVDKTALIDAGAPGVAELLDPRRPAHISEVAVSCGWPDDWAFNITVLPSLDRESLAERNEEGARPGAATRLRRALEADGWADGLHDIIIDTGPNVDHLLFMAMSAANRAILVTEAKYDSIEGAVYLAYRIAGYRLDGILPDLDVAGVVVNAYNDGAARQVENFNAMGATFAAFGGPAIIWDPPVPYIVSLANSHEDAVPVSAIRHVSVNQLAPVYDAHADRLIATQTGALV